MKQLILVNEDGTQENLGPIFLVASLVKEAVQEKSDGQPYGHVYEGRNILCSENFDQSIALIVSGIVTLIERRAKQEENPVIAAIVGSMGFNSEDLTQQNLNNSRIEVIDAILYRLYSSMAKYHVSVSDYHEERITDTEEPPFPPPPDSARHESNSPQG